MRLLNTAIAMLMASPILAMEFFNRARQFRAAYEALRKSGHRAQPPEWPKYLLVFHATELALKAYLIQKGVSKDELKNKFGHNIEMLVTEAVNSGLSLPYGSKDMIADLGGGPDKAGEATVPPHLRIRYPLDDPRVFSLGQFEGHMEILFNAVASALGTWA